MKTEISNELILQAHKEACGKWKSLIEKECPELFKPKFKVGDWVVNTCRGNEYIGKYIDNKHLSDWSFITNSIGQELNGGLFDDNARLATQTEIKSHLIKLAKEKGFKEGVKVLSLWGGGVERVLLNKENYPQYEESKDELWFGDTFCSSKIYSNGKWATIIEEPKVIELTMEDIAKLKGVDVSQIKILK